MAPMTELIEKVLNILNPKLYNRREDLEKNQIAELDKSNWIFVPKEEGKKFRVISDYSFHVSPSRLSYSPAVEKIGKELKINYKNTAKDSLGREFVGNNGWKESLMLNQFLGVKTTNMKEEVDYLRLLYLGSQDEIKVFDFAGKQVDSKLCEKLLMDTIKTQPPLRANWIDADYKPNRKNLEVHSDHIFDKQGNIIDYKSEVLDKDTLMEYKQIDFVDFITKNHTSQGHVSKKIKSGDFNSYPPLNNSNSVALLDANSDGAFLNCSVDPFDSDSDLGVRASEKAK